VDSKHGISAGTGGRECPGIRNLNKIFDKDTFANVSVNTPHCGEAVEEVIELLTMICAAVSIRKTFLMRTSGTRLNTGTVPPRDEARVKYAAL